MRLRFATEEDAAALADVHGKAFDSAWTAPDIARLMTILGGFALVAEDEGIVGFVLARSVGGEAEILTLAVAPWARRRGVGAALVEAVAVHAGAAGSKALFLEVAADNEAAVGVYLKTGFKQAGLRRAYYQRPGAAAMDALVLRRALNSRPS
jgi:ribosomal-protein-alanine N-acetyltransferase